LTGVYSRQGRYSEAEQILHRSYSILTNVLGENNPLTQVLWNNLWDLVQTTVNAGRVEELSDHPHIATQLNGLAEAYRQKERYDEAEPLYERALAIREQQLGADHPLVAQTLNNIGLLRQSQERYAEAELLYERAIYIWEQHLETDYTDVATGLNNLAFLYQVQGRYAEAAPLYQRLRSIREQEQLDSNHPNTPIIFNNLESFYRSQEQYVKAVQNYHDVALQYQEKRQYSQAESCYQQSLAVREQWLGSDHPDVALSLNSLAVLYYSQERYAEAELLYIRAMTILGSQLGANHPSTQTCKQNFLSLLNQAFVSGYTSQLSDHPLTQAVLQQLQIGNSNA